MSKVELRAAMRRARKSYVASLDSSERETRERALAVVIWPLASQARCFAIYSPVGSEIDPRLVTSRHDCPSTAYPAFTDATAQMTFRSGLCAEDCPVGGVQPPPQAIAVIPELVFVPLLAVDPVGNRLGQGGGHYDRALPALRTNGATLIGIGWEMQRLDFALPADPWDVPLDGFASPSGLEMFS
ncbi:MAG: 5-formyltetrahydrofolate cyclo-ligase [Sphingomonas sp.]|uniref:5-formyltetrahydrofolate cyclo-ligase n=1 Tax=Sphingomonas sp. TaxID=28214 RepID=UPI00183BA6C4|nr:5-formyltetrahydrofolate cyclo-ligase [Sphingomonas sp.]MBA3667836.1 5-formyltetrahydrofolate cyclo-ligase [Sphingomonas sp.]